MSPITISRIIKDAGWIARKKKEAINLIGRRFGRLVVVDRHGTINGCSVWKCLCDCGKTTYPRRNALVDGLTVSCGCFRKEKMFLGVGDLSNCYWNRILKGAVSRNLKIEITSEYVWNLFVEQGGKCAISGLDINIVRNYTKDHKKHTASLDRIDNRVGYIRDNVHWVHRDINIMKGSKDMNHFIKLCKAVAENNCG